MYEFFAVIKSRVKRKSKFSVKSGALKGKALSYTN